MKSTIQVNNRLIIVDFSKPIDISIPLSNSDKNPIAWYLNKPEINPVTFDNWIGSVQKGSSTNFNNIIFNPHAHGTHTECLGHITHDFYSINQILKNFMFIAELISVEPTKINDDLVITKEIIELNFKSDKNPQALIIRTLPNQTSKKSTNYSNTNPPYLSEDATKFIVEKGIKHLLVDLPSIDREMDEGKLVSHKAFWKINNIKDIDVNTRLDATITEMIFVENNIIDGSYLLNLQIASFENDASPSKPILYKIEEN